jgi:bifunctional N-acetylglucosamine-1-phosphate-uridyltransferase/glucosamine-1-phosphate-acetyltransferase GlmU-like protein
VITMDIPQDALGVARGKQRNLEGWAANFRAKKKAIPKAIS